MQVATWYYVHGWSQARIAETIGLDPSTVSRHLKRARDDGFVRIEIRRPPGQRTDLGRAVAELYGLSRVIVVAADGDVAMEAVAAAAAEHIDGLLRSGMRLGISWGRTLAAAVRHFRPGSVSGITISQLAGGIDESSPGIQGHDLVRMVAALYPNSHAQYLHAPAVVDSPDIRDALMADHSVRRALDAAAASELALVGIGGMQPYATLARGRHLKPDDRQRLLDAGAIGNINTRFFDEVGRPVGHLENRTIALAWEQLQAIPTVVAVAAGVDKAHAIGAALRSGCIDMLVTDEAVARTLTTLEPPGAL